MNLRRPFTVCIVMLILESCCLAGTTYRITSSDGTKEVTYEVRFGGGRQFEQFTAFDPASKDFVYLRWTRGEQKPEPAGSIWDHKTGAIVLLYKFPEVAQPLPVIPSVEDLTICPKTGGKIISKKTFIRYD
jgi:hypothetical protein